MLNCRSILIFNGIYIEGKLKYKNIEKAPFDLYFARVALYPTFFPKDNLHLNMLFYGRHILLNLIHVDPCFIIYGSVLHNKLLSCKLKIV